VTANKEKSMKLARIAVLALALCATAAFVGVGLPEGASGSADATGHTITVNGSGKASTVPDRACFTFGVDTKRNTAVDASNTNNRDMQQLIDALRARRRAGEGHPDVADLPLSRLLRLRRLARLRGDQLGDRVRLLERAGAALQAAVGAGANQVDGPSLTKADSDKLYADALRAAVADARARAEVLAAAAGVKVGEVVSIVEGSTSSGPIAYDMAASPEAPIQPGTQDIEATVTVTFAIA
jgi:uncharacterized protein